MDHEPGLSTETSERPRGDAQLAVASRRRALDRLRSAALEGQACPVLITGEPGAGKTWLTHQLGRLLPSSWSTAGVDLTRAMTALDFLQLIGQSLGVPLSESLGSARARLHSILHDDDVDGRRWLLVIDEAHRGSLVVWDEIQALVNQSGRRGGFAALIVLGDTELVRALSTRGFGGFASALRLHLHLPPLDLDEARELLKFAGQEELMADRGLDELHRDARGNASGLLRLAQRRPAPPRVASNLSTDCESHDADPAWPRSSALRMKKTQGPDEPQPLEIDQPAAARMIAVTQLDNQRPVMPSLIPTKPPIRVEEGLVEVGWDGDLEADFSEPDDKAPSARETRSADSSSFSEELIEDRYATLQAWSEWTESKERTTRGGVAIESSPSRGSAETLLAAQTPATEEQSASREPARAAAPTDLRAEPQHEFAPYSQLFTRLRQSKQP